MKVLYFALFALILSSCAGSYTLLHQNDLEQIPEGSSKVVVHVPYDQNKLLTHIAKYFAREGYPVQTDKVAMQVSTGFKSIEGGASVRMIASVDTVENGSRVIISGEWGLNSDGQAAMYAFAGMNMSGTSNKVINEGRLTSTKPGIAFQHMVLAAKSVPAGTITYK